MKTLTKQPLGCDRALRRLFSLSLICGMVLSSGIAPASMAQQQRSHSIAAAESTAKSKTNNTSQARSNFQGSDSGALLAFTGNNKALGKCALKHTDVTANVSGYVARVKVKQTFANPYSQKIEAVYTFPLSQTGAVDSMVMKVGKRTIKGNIKKREEAKQIYEDAKNAGYAASLLEQERPNIFTQSVANIMPGEAIEITLEYVDVLPYESGKYTFAFPTVVGPRFNPGQATGKSGTGFSPDTDQVKDASRITPNVAPKGERAGHDISIQVKIDAGMEIQNIDSALHQVTATGVGRNRAFITLKDEATIPNKDFVLSWQVAGNAIKSGCLTHKEGSEGFFNLMMLPPKRVTTAEIAPKEMIFLIDCSGSQSGAPMQKCKETMNYILDHMNANDTFQVIAFSNDVRPLFAKPMLVNAGLRAQAKDYISKINANGGTFMLPAVKQVCAIPSDDHRLRIITFMTDGYVGNDFEVLGAVKESRKTARWFSFGTGNSVNRFLVDNIAKEGGGEADYVLLNSSAQEVGKKFYDRIASPVLTDIHVAFEGLEAKEVYPKDISDVWAEKPLYMSGRYEKPGSGKVVITGYAGGKPYKNVLNVTFPESEKDNAALSSVWARAKVDFLMAQDLVGAQNGAIKKELQDEVIQVALKHHILTQYTSFVAVEDKVIRKGDKAVTVAVPVEMPDGVEYSGVFGEEAENKTTSIRENYFKRYPSASVFRSRGNVSAMPPPGIQAIGSTGGGGGYSASAGGTISMNAPVPSSMSSPVRSKAVEKTRWHQAPRQFQIIDARPNITCYNFPLSSGARPAAQKEAGLSVKKDGDLKVSDALSSDTQFQIIQRAQSVSKNQKLEADKKTVVVKVKLRLSKVTEQLIALLKKAGLQIENVAKDKLEITGMIDASHIDELKKIKGVKNVEVVKNSEVKSTVRSTEVKRQLK